MNSLRHCIYWLYRAFVAGGADYDSLSLSSYITLHYKIVPFCQFSKIRNITHIIWNIRFVENLIGNMGWNFHEDDIITVTSVSSIFVPSVFFHNSLVKHIETESNQNAKVQQQILRIWTS